MIVQHYQSCHYIVPTTKLMSNIAAFVAILFTVKGNLKSSTWKVWNTIYFSRNINKINSFKSMFLFREKNFYRDLQNLLIFCFIMIDCCNYEKKIIIFWLSKRKKTIRMWSQKSNMFRNMSYNRNKCNVIGLIFIKEKCKRKTCGKMQWI